MTSGQVAARTKNSRSRSSRGRLSFANKSLRQALPGAAFRRAIAFFLTGAFMLSHAILATTSWPVLSQANADGARNTRRRTDNPSRRFFKDHLCFLNTWDRAFSKV